MCLSEFLLLFSTMKTINLKEKKRKGKIQRYLKELKFQQPSLGRDRKNGWELHGPRLLRGVTNVT